MKIVLFKLWLLLLALAVTACSVAPITPPTQDQDNGGGGGGGGGTAGGVVQSSKSRESAPQVSPEDQAALVSGNNEFAYNLYQSLRGEEGNLFFSPYSISLALAMTYAGARGETESQMAQAMNFSLPQAQLHPAFNTLDQLLISRADNPQDPQSPEKLFQLNIANALWGQSGHTFLAEFLDLLAVNYGAGLRLEDFQNAPEEARQKINGWVSDQTQKRIPDLLPQGSVTPDTRLVLTNAIYFKAAWQNQFEESSTQPGPFHLPDGSQVEVPMMQQEKTYNYAQAEGFQAVELPYEGGQLAMLVLLPDEGSLQDFEQKLSSEQIQSLANQMQYTNLALSLPKFTFSSSFGLADTLSELGMPAAFDPNQADFSGMDGNRDLSISDVVHKAFVNVDETGTEAAAATGVIVGVTSAPPPAIPLKIDRPFLFLIRDLETGAILFVGRVINPAA